MIKYRICCFNIDGSFHHVVIKDSIEEAVIEKLKWLRKMNDNADVYGTTKIYKCNEKGNNYSGREVYI